MSTVAAPGVAERAEALADAACELHDTVSTPASWSADAVEDAVESMETTALALAVAHPEAAAAMFAIGQQLAQLRERLGLPPGEHPGSRPHRRRGPGRRPTDADPVPPTRPRPRLPGRADSPGPYRVRVVGE